MDKFVICRGSGMTLGKRNVTVDIKVPGSDLIANRIIKLPIMLLNNCSKVYLIQNSPAVKQVCGPKNSIVKKDVKSKVAAKKWL